MIKYYTIDKDYNLNMPLLVKKMGNDRLEVLNEYELKVLNEILNNNKFYSDCLDALNKRISFWGASNLKQASYSRLYRAITMKEFYVSDLKPTYIYWTMDDEDYELRKEGKREVPEIWPVLTEHEFEELGYLLSEAHAYSSLLSHVFEDLLDETDGVSFTERGFDKVASILIDGEFYVEVRHELDGEDDE